MVLNLATSLISPQYHCHFDDIFETAHHNQLDIVTSAMWKQLAELCQADGTPTSREPLETFAKLHRILQE